MDTLEKRNHNKKITWPWREWFSKPVLENGRRDEENGKIIDFVRKHRTHLSFSIVPIEPFPKDPERRIINSNTGSGRNAAISNTVRFITPAMPSFQVKRCIYTPFERACTVTRYQIIEREMRFLRISTSRTVTSTTSPTLTASRGCLM